jgi:hypothetical protein
MPEESIEHLDFDQLNQKRIATIDQTHLHADPLHMCSMAVIHLSFT